MFCVTVIDSNIFNNNKYPMKSTHTNYGLPAGILSSSSLSGYVTNVSAHSG